MLDQFLVGKREKDRNIMCIERRQHPVGGQLMGAEPTEFAAGLPRWWRRASM